MSPPRAVLASLLLVVLGLLVPGLTGCKSSECARMAACCAEVEGLKGVGESCGTLAEETANPDTCRAVTRTVRFMLEDRDKPIPQICQPAP